MAHEPLATVLRHLRQLVGAPAAADVSDGQLLDRFVAQGEESAFTTLVQRHGPLVLSVCRRLLPDANDAEDAFQATFVVLIRRASSLRREGSLGSWLYTVAYRIALKARAGAARRHSREQQAEDMAYATLPDDQRHRADPPTQASHRELAGVLDAEVAQLPEKYRAPLILCYLEGKTNEEAARELGCPVGSMSWRLDKGRELLRRRLVGRGLTLAAGGLALALGEHAATAALPTALCETTLQTARLLAAGNAGAVAASVTVLADGMLHGMMTAKLRIAAVILLVFSVAGAGATVLAYRTLGTAAVPQEEAPGIPFADWVELRVDHWQPTKAERRIDDIGWAADIRTAIKLAQEHNRPIFLFTHEGRIGTGRCGGSAFNLRAHTFADERVIARLNRSFIPVFATNEDHRKDGTAADAEKAEKNRIYHQTIQAKLHSGEDCIYILTPDGQPFDSVSVATAKKADQLLDRLEQVVQKLGTVAGAPVVQPKALSVPPAAAPDDLVLHLTARAFHRKAWCEFPAENWIVLKPAEWEQFVPPGAAAAGSSWDIPPALSARLLTCFYPQTENNNLAGNRLDQQALRATVIGAKNGMTRVRLDGELRMKHQFYADRLDNSFAEATVVGYLDFDVSRRRLRSLRLVTDRATYAGHDFGIAVRSVP